MLAHSSNTVGNIHFRVGKSIIFTIARKRIKINLISIVDFQSSFKKSNKFKLALDSSKSKL